MSEPSVPPPPSYTPPPPPPASGTVSPNRNLMIVLSYIWILFLVPLLAEKNDPEVQWHAKHGAVITVTEIIVWIAVWILSMVTAFVHLGCAGCFLHLGVWIAFLVLRILCIMKGVSGQRFIIPGISQYADRF
ncbi:MAG TPA: hypothetical protein VOA87_03270 [Thermoanaerobaculia bacterium]|nr:hypothetical protein [Thermoanaerobaculia bacterium]